MLDTVNFTSAFELQTHFEWRTSPGKLRNSLLDFFVQPRIRLALMLVCRSAQWIDQNKIIATLLIIYVRPQRGSLVIFSVYGVLLGPFIFGTLGYHLLRLFFCINRGFSLNLRLPADITQNCLVLLVQKRLNRLVPFVAASLLLVLRDRKALVI